MSESGAFAASMQSAVAPGDSFSSPALAAVNPTSEWVRLSISRDRLLINQLRLEVSLVAVVRSDRDRVFATGPQLPARLLKWVSADYPRP